VGRIQDAWDALTKKAVPLQGIGQPFASYQMVGGTFVGIADNRTNYIRDGYQVNDILYSTITLITDKVKLPDWSTYKVVDEAAFKSYEGLMRKKDLSTEDYKKAMGYKKKALEPIFVDRLTELLRYPNDYETFQDLVANSTGWKLITGGRCVWAQMLDMGANQGKPFQLHNLPYQEVAIIASSNMFPIVETGYMIPVLSDALFPKAQVLHDKYTNYDWDINGAHLYGMSPLKAALRRLSRSNSAIKASAAMLENQGVKGVLYVDDPRVIGGGVDVADTRKQVEAIKSKLVGKGEWVGSENWGRIGVSGYKMGWQSVGLNPVELSIIDSEKWDLKRFASVYGVPSQLVGDSESSTYNNVREAEKALTVRCAMPQLVSFRNHFNRKLQTDWGYKGQNIYVDFDQTVFTELQEDVAEKSTWIKDLKALSPNEQRMLLGLERIDDSMFDEPWITTQDGMPLSEYNVPAESLPLKQYKSEGEKISFDYDGVLSTAKGKEEAMSEIEDGSTVYIISARSDKAGMLGTAKELGIPASRVFATGSNKAKVQKIKDLGIDKHYDNNNDIIDEVNQFAEGELFGD
jgi:HK97 family phage portal protein